MSTDPTLLGVWHGHVQAQPDKVFLRQPFGDTWRELTYKQVDDHARRVAAALKSLGIEAGDHVGILSRNCSEWIISDLAIMMAGAISVPFYATLSTASLREVVELSDVKLCFVGKLEHYDPAALEGVKTIGFPHYKGNARIEANHEWSEVLAEFEPLEEVAVRRPDETFTILFTSGTTGTPKGVMLPFSGSMDIAENEKKTPVFQIYTGATERLFSFLPLNHVAERVAVEMAAILSGGSISFAESLETFNKNVVESRPTYFFAVPRIWTKFREGVLAKVGGKDPAKKLDFLLKIPFIGNSFRKKILAGLGLEHVQVAVSGAAPIPRETLEWYQRLGLTIQEVYGMSETHGPATFNPPDDVRPGTVGKAVPGTEVKLDPETNEVMYKAPWNMTGYYNDPDKTKQVLQDGWIRTGDEGKLDKDGYLTLVGRVSDAFKGSKGKYVVPAPIEAKLGAEDTVGMVMVTGRGLPKTVALVCLSEGAQEMAEADVKAALKDTWDSVNKGLEIHERIGCMVVLAKEFAVEDDTLTPTLKIRRRTVDRLYESKYEGWLETGGILWKAS